MTPPLENQDHVHVAAFSPDGARVVTASRDRTTRVWALLIDMGSLENWQLLARCLGRPRNIAIPVESVSR